MQTLTALFDAPAPAAAALYALAGAGFPAADVDVVAARPLSDTDAPAGGDWAAELALRARRLADDPVPSLAEVLDGSLRTRGLPAPRAAAVAQEVASGRAFLVAVTCPERRADLALRTLLGALAVEVFAA